MRAVPYRDTSTITVAYFIVNETDREECENLCMQLSHQVKSTVSQPLVPISALRSQLCIAAQWWGMS